MNHCLICSDCGSSPSQTLGSEFDLVNSFLFLFKTKDKYTSIIDEQDLSECYYCSRCVDLLKHMTPTIKQFKELEKKINEFRIQIEDLFYKAQLKYDNRESNDEPEIRNYKMRKILSKDYFKNGQNRIEMEESVTPEFSNEIFAKEIVKIQVKNPLFVVIDQSNDNYDSLTFVDKYSKISTQNSLSSSFCPSSDSDLSEEESMESPKRLQRTKGRKLTRKRKTREFSQQEIEFLKLDALSKTVQICLKRVEEMPPEELRQLSITPQVGKSSKVFRVNCELCNKYFFSKGSLKVHKNVIHGSIGESFDCKECNKHFSTLPLLERHVIQYHSENPYQCDFCSKKFPFLKKHFDEFHLNEKFSCEACGMTFKWYRNLLTHKNTVHVLGKMNSAPSKKKFNKLTSKYKLKNLKKTKETSNNTKDETLHTCELCGYICKSKSALSKHLNKVHSILSNSESDQGGLCPICGKTVKNLKAHQKIHQLEYCSCDICGKAFKSQKNLKIHKNSSHPDPSKEYKCAKCDKIFHSQKNHYRHLKCFHTEPRFKCDICPKKFPTKQQLQSHKFSHTEGPGQFVCQVEGCGQTLKDIKNMRRHMMGHIDKRPHQCSICGKRFYTRIHLTTHSAVHSDDRPFLCSICGASFKIKVGLNQHMRGFHKQRGEKPPIKRKRIKLINKNSPEDFV